MTSLFNLREHGDDLSVARRFALPAAGLDQENRGHRKMREDNVNEYYEKYRIRRYVKPSDPIPVMTAAKMIVEVRLDELLGLVIAAVNDSTATADVKKVIASPDTIVQLVSH